MTKLKLKIGKTSIIMIQYPNCCPIFAKAEYLNPTGSHKDRGYLKIIESLEKEKTIIPGKTTLVDYTSGNGGASLAFIGKEKGYDTIAVMPDNMTIERKEQIKKYGKLILTPKEEFIKGARLKAEQLVKENKNYYLINQSDNPLNVDAFKDMGKEFVDYLEKKNIKPKVFIGAIGTGASTSGIVSILKEYDKEIFCVGFEPLEAASTFSQKYNISTEIKEHKLIGTGPGKVALNNNVKQLDYIELISSFDTNSLELLEGKRLLEELNLSCGRTSKAAIYLAKKYSSLIGEKNGCVLTVFYDAGWKYFSEDK
jgi:cysteine synthase A